MSISGFFQFIIGFTLGIILLAGGGAAAGYLFLSNLSGSPTRPVFPEEIPEVEPPSEEVEEGQIAPEAEAEPEATSEAEPEATSPEQELEAGSYKARVNWSEGLSLRSDPNANAQRVGGVAYNRELVVLEESADGEWLKVRHPNADGFAWMKSGNIEKID